MEMERGDPGAEFALPWIESFEFDIRSVELRVLIPASIGRGSAARLSMREQTARGELFDERLAVERLTVLSGPNAFRLRPCAVDLAGAGRRANLSAHLSPLARGARLSFFDPRTLGRDIRASASVFQERREEPSFTFENVGFELILQRPFGDRVTGSLGYEFRVNELSDIDVQVPSPQTLAEPDVGLVSAGFLFDDRDDALLPERGRRARAKVEFAGSGLGSEIDFLRTRIDFSWLRPVTEGAGLALLFRSVWIAPPEDGVEIPLQERAFSGGENSVRSFREDELGPRDAGGEALGGEASTVLSAELRRGLGGNFSGALFFDAGNVILEREDYFKFDDFHFAVGLGLRYALPIGPLRLDLGFNPAARDGEDDFVLHFSVGFPY